MISDLIEEFSQLTNLLTQLRVHLLNNRPHHYFPLSDNERTVCDDTLQHACDLLSDLWYQDNQDGRETRTRHGLILADKRTIDLIGRINQQKDCFRLAVNEEKQSLDAEQWLARQHQLGRQSQSLRTSLTFAGLQRVHLKQSYRHIPLLSQKPTKVGFSWYNNGRSIKKISHSQAQELLLDLGEEKTHIQVQLQTLAKLSANTQLARVQLLAPTMRANLVFNSGEDTLRRAMNSPLPLFIPATHENDQSLPEFNRIGLLPPTGRTRISRRDNRITEAAILPSIRAFGYSD